MSHAGEFADIPVGDEHLRFEILRLDDEFPAVPAVYLISCIELIRRLSRASYPYQILGLGVAASLREEVKSHASWNRWIELGADIVLYHAGESPERLAALYERLAEIYRDCNF